MSMKGEMMSKVITEKESIIWASGHYLTEHLPEEYDEWEDEELDEEKFWNKLYDLGLEKRPESHTIVITSDDTTVGEWEVVE